ncbi:MAG TPA: hypothetical protein VLE22_10060 [Bryobacteraceae bacterium]|nr:hypothetical protein [Bryobacteraceae bacterium]
MLVRIRVRYRPARKTTISEERRRLLRSVENCLMSGSAAALLLVAWCLATDLDWAGRFSIPSGRFSHWQLWLALAVLLQVLRSWLGRYGRGGDEAMP